MSVKIVKSLLATTVSYPAMNLSLNLYEEQDFQRSDTFALFQNQVAKVKLQAIIRSRERLPMFAPEHKIQPPRPQPQPQPVEAE